MMKRLDDWFQDWDNISLRCEMAESKQALELLKPNNYGCTRHEPDYRSMWQEIHQKPQPELKWTNQKTQKRLAASASC